MPQNLEDLHLHFLPLTRIWRLSSFPLQLSLKPWSLFPNEFGRTGGRVGTVNNRTRFCSQLLNQMRFFCRKRPKPGRLTSRKGQLKLHKYKTQSWEKNDEVKILFDLKFQLAAQASHSIANHGFLQNPVINLSGFPSRSWKESSHLHRGVGRRSEQKSKVANL